MKKLIFAWVFIGMGFISFGQSQEKVPGDSIPWEIRKQSFIYNSANMFNDVTMAKMALYNLLAENPGNVALYDTLSLIYYQSRQFASAALVAQQASKINPNDMFAVEVAASSFDQLGVKDKALSNYEKLYLNESDINLLYKMSFLQYELSRYQEANNSLNIILGDPSAKENMVAFPTTEGTPQEASLEIAALRVKAMIEQAKGNKEEAKKQFLSILEKQPGLQIVQQQLRDLTKKEGE